MSENFSNNEEENTPVTPSTPDIDEIQEAIRQKMKEDEASDPDYFDDFESSGDNLPNEGDDTSSLENEYYDMTPQEKKFVVAVTPDNVPFFDKLPPEERAKLINKLLEKHQEEIKVDPEKLRIQKLVKHCAVIFITVAVGLPLIFYTVNTSIEATVNSYRQVQQNFEKLYQQKGGIKRKDLTKIQNLSY